MSNFIGATIERRSGGFIITQLAQNLAICEAEKDEHGWNNATDNKPAFLVYIGCSQAEVSSWVEKIRFLYMCDLIEVRKPKRLKGFEAELKIKGMQRHFSQKALGLDNLVEEQTQSSLEALTIFDYKIIMQSDLKDAEGVPEHTEEFIYSCFNPVSRETLEKTLDWSEVGYHMAMADLKAIRHRRQGELVATAVWPYAGEEIDEF